MPIDQEEAARRAFPMLDHLESLSWNWRLTAAAEGEEAANRKYPAPVGVIDVVRTIVFEMCEGDVVQAIQTVKDWTEAKWARLTFQDLQRGRRLNISQLTHSIMFVGIGNLCGINSPEDEFFDQELAEEGARRGWRKPLETATTAPSDETAPRRLVALWAPPPLPKPLEQMTKEEVREHVRPWAEEIVAEIKRRADEQGSS